MILKILHLSLNNIINGVIYNSSLHVSCTHSGYEYITYYTLHQDIDLVDTTIIKSTSEHGRFYMKCKDPLSDDKIECIRQHLEAMAEQNDIQHLSPGI